MRCVSKKTGLDANGRLKPGHKYETVACIRKVGKKGGKKASGGRCEHGRVTRGKNKGKCRTRPNPDFSQFRKTKGRKSVAAAYQSSVQAAAAYNRGARGERPSDYMQAASSAYQRGAAEFAARNRGSGSNGRRRRDPKTGKFV
jgi:hypothetical protein